MLIILFNNFDKKLISIKMQRHSYSETNQIIQDQNENKISVNSLLPNQSKFLNTLYQNSGDEIQSEKFKTYRVSAVSNSEFFNEFIFENEEKSKTISLFLKEISSFNRALDLGQQIKKITLKIYLRI